MNRVMILLGSNINKEVNIAKAIEQLHQSLNVLSVSSIYESIAVPDASRPHFLNAAILAETLLLPSELKTKVLSQIEQQCHRQRSQDKNSSRTIDLDIVFFNHEVSCVQGIVIPDPESLTCPHIALPVAEVEPDYIHPLCQRTLASIAAPWRQQCDTCWQWQGQLPAY